MKSYRAILILLIYATLTVDAASATSADDVRMVEAVEKNRCEFVEQDTCSTIRSNAYGRCQEWHKRRAAQLSANTFKIVSYDLSGGFGRSTVVADYYDCRNAKQAKIEDTEPVKSSGTGFFVSSDGYIVTNYHVISNAKEIIVSKVSGKKFIAEPVKLDIANDLALLKSDAESDPLFVRHSNQLQKGSSVFTLGYPIPELQGNEQKATFGRINSLTGLLGTYNLYQIDVSIQAGNSGGPLLDEQGYVVGVVTSSLSDSFVFKATGSIPQNVNYAIKSDYLLPLLDDMDVQRKYSNVSTESKLADLISEIEESVVSIEVERY